MLLVLFPIYWMVITSLKLPREIYRAALALAAGLHARTTIDNLIEDKGFLTAIRNSLIVAATRDRDLGADLVLRGLLDGALPLPLPRA